MLASGFTPIYAAHVPAASYRTGCIGTGPFKVKEWRKGEFVEYVRNPDYFVKGRPYLDGLRYLIIAERGTARRRSRPAGWMCRSPARPRSASPTSSSGRLPARDHPGETERARPPRGEHRKPPSTIPRCARRSAAIDRRGFVAPCTRAGPPRRLHAAQALRRVGHARGRSARPAGRPDRARRARSPAVPRRGGIRRQNRAPGRAPHAGASGVRRSLRRSWSASSSGSGIDASLRQVDSAQWVTLQARGEFQIGVDRTGLEPDDPDANFYENYGCGSTRNYSGYCDEEIAKLIDQQSQELDPKKRLALVQEIQRKLEDVAVRPVLGWRLDYFTVWPHVKNLVPHHSIYGWGRMQDVWRDR